MTPAPVQTYAQREQLRLDAEAVADERRKAEAQAPSAWLEITLIVGIVVACFIAAWAIRQHMPVPSIPITTCPTPLTGEVLVVTVTTAAGGQIQANCSTARGRTAARTTTPEEKTR